MFQDFMKTMSEIVCVQALAVHGVRQQSNADEAVRAATRILKALPPKPGEPPYDSNAAERDIKHADEIAAWARAELARDFRTLHVQSCVAFWAALDTFIEDLTVACLEHDSALMERDELAKVRLPLAEFMLLTEDERRRLLVSELTRREGFQAGIGKFDKMLGFVGLGGATRDETKRTLLELGEVRNCLVHRGGRADRRLLRLCPWLCLKIDELIPVSDADCARYSDAILDYWYALRARAGIEKRTAEESLADSPATQYSGNRHIPSP